MAECSARLNAFTRVGRVARHGIGANKSGSRQAMTRLKSFFTPRVKLFVAFAALAAAVFAVRASPSRDAGAALLAGDQGSSPAYTMTSTATYTPAGGPPRLYATYVRHQRRDGLFKLVSTYHQEDGSADRVVTTYGADGLGVFVLDEGRGRLVFRGPLPEAPGGEATGALRAHPHYNREEAVSGVAATVLREEDEEGGGFTETFHAPALAGLVVKRVRESEGTREVFETTSVEAGDPDPAQFAGWRHTADYGDYARKVERESARSRAHEAERMARALEKAKRLKP